MGEYDSRMLKQIKAIPNISVVEQSWLHFTFLTVGFRELFNDYSW